MERLTDGALPREPIGLFRRWLEEARRSVEPEPTATTLATTGGDGRPSARMVLLKGVDASGLIFVTHYGSRKGRQLQECPEAAMLFAWLHLGRQVRVEGTVSRCPGELSDALYDARPRGARIGAWASPQSEPLADRAELERRVDEIRRRFPERIPRPPFWGGFALAPRMFEFWQAGDDRLHDRFRYSDDGAGGWMRTRLAP